MDDVIALQDIAVSTHIGVTDAERVSAQTVFVSVEMHTDTARAGASDDVRDSIDYDAVAAFVQKLGETERKTLEKFAEDTAAAVLAEFAPARVKVAVTKPDISGSRGATVTIIRPR